MVFIDLWRFGGINGIDKYDMRIKEIILEYKRDITASKLGEKLYTKLMSEPKDWIRRGVGFDINNIDKNRVVDAILEKIEAADPTNNKQYVMWIIRVYLNTKIYLEDAITEPTMALAKFYKLTRAKKIQPPYNDINRIKDINQLEQIVSEFPDEEKVLVDKGNSEEIYRDNEIRVIIPLDETAACYYGQGTKWCTASNHNNMYDAYTENGDKLYIILPQNPTYPGEKYQLCFEDNQFMDERDEPVEFTDLLNKYPSLKLALKNEPDFDYTIILSELSKLLSENKLNKRDSKIEHLLLKIKNKKDFADYCSLYIIELSNINYPFDEIIREIQLAAVKSGTWNTIKFIKNPSEEVQLVALKRNGYAIECIKNPTEKAQLTAVKQSGIVIKFIETPSEAVQLTAVNQNGRALRYIERPSEKVQLDAVQNNGYAIEYIENPSEKVQLAAVNQNQYAIRYVKNPSEKVQLAAVKENAYAIQYIKNPTPKVVKLYKELTS